jgi:hypothetical protein
VLFWFYRDLKGGAGIVGSGCQYVSSLLEGIALHLHVCSQINEGNKVTVAARREPNGD